MTLKEEMQKFGFATVNYPSYLTRLVREMMGSWQTFCELPLQTKSRFTYTGDAGAGYEFKDEPGATKDRKENFHFTISEMNRLVAISNETGIGRRFADNALSLLIAIRSPLGDFAQRLEGEFGLEGVRDEVFESWSRWFLRLLHYPPGAELGQIIAAHHVDKLGLTMYLGETTPGVQYYKHPGEWLDMPVLSGKTIITPNMQVQYKTNGDLKALYHRVVANEVSAVQGRYAIVCFADFLRTPQYDKETQGRLQDKPLGFNHTLSNEEFQRLFK